MAESQEARQPSREPLASYAEYLSHPDTPFDCWFNVGDPKTITPERIGGSKLHLMAHSVLFRRMLHESPLAEKDAVNITDIEPTTFRHFLRFVHGHFDVTDLSMEEAVALLCAAEKYFVDHLRQRLGEHISSMITVDNVFLPMSYQESYQEETLKNSIEKIVQQETSTLVARDEFLELNTVGLTYIVTQDCLQISEVELWRAVLAWARHQAGSNKAVDLRGVLSPVLSHIRFCTMEDKEFNKEVAATGILSDGEIASVVKILGGASVIKTLAENVSELNSICYQLDARRLYRDTEFEIDFQSMKENIVGNTSSTWFCLTTEEQSVQLLSATLPEIKSSTVNNFWCAPKKLTAYCECKIHMWKITNYSTNGSTEAPIEFTFVQKDVLLDRPIVLAFPKEMKLEPLNKYKLALIFTQSHGYLRSDDLSKTLSNKGLLVSGDMDKPLYSQVLAFKYKLL